MLQILTAWVSCCILALVSFAGSSVHNQISPGHAQVDGVILSLFNKDNAQWAFVKITAIKGYGSGFRGALNPSDTIEVRLPIMSSEGGSSALSTNDKFSGSIKQGISELGDSLPTTYEMNNYTKL